MTALKTTLDQDTVENLGIWQAATMDGYWNERANADIQYVYLLGQYQATKSMHTSYGNKGSLRRLKNLQKKIETYREEVTTNE